MEFDDILSAPGFTVDQGAADGLRIVLRCLISDFSDDRYGGVEQIVPDYENKCVSIVYKTFALMSDQDHAGSYLADLFRIVDAVAIFPAEEGIVRISFTSVVWN